MLYTDGDEASSQVIKVVIRGPFGRQVWIMEPKSQPAGTVRPGNVKRPAPAEYKAPKPRIAQRWWPSSVDSIPLVKAYVSILLPTLFFSFDEGTYTRSEKL